MMPYGLFRALHSHNPAEYSDIVGIDIPLLSSYSGGALSQKTTPVQAHRGF